MNTAKRAAKRQCVVNTLRENKLKVLGHAGESVRRFIMVVLSLVDAYEKANLRQKDLVYDMGIHSNQ